MKIIVDAFGGDNAPLEVIKGCVKALEVYNNIEIILVGSKEIIEKTKLLFTNTDYNVSFSRHISVSAALLLQDSRKE